MTGSDKQNGKNTSENDPGRNGFNNGTNGERKARSRNSTARPVLITGGAGFVGSNLAGHLLQAGERVLIFDNLSRPGVELNLRWLRKQYPDNLEVQVADVRDFSALISAVSR